MFNSQRFNFAGTGLEAKWIIAGVVATGAVVAIAAKGKSTTEGHAQAQEQQAVAQQQAAQQQQAQQQAAQQQQAQQQAAGGGGSGGAGGGTPVPCPELCPKR